MHELGLMQSALDLAGEHARRAGANRILRMRLRVGALSGVVVEALEMAFAVATPGTVAEGAELIVDPVPVVCRCQHCGSDFQPTDVVYCCPLCGDISARFCQGLELELASLEVS